ncbi:glycosyltransferase family 2 protein [Paenibacillus dendritiformis]|uniref:glycosyltransferase family 2 protein n=1 Tax=Paenibacillus dendritiformis TaxID=130049 RepID=UPI000DA7C817|nr:glycosyltransferase family 2 protein [Paenibacillus dendritiformis]PZM67231.1 hypothetical protein DOE73_01980 [Paenibacillus dendritiformis]
MRPKISVIIPVYNVQEYLENCLESVVQQTIGIENLEVIIVNDGSTDNSVDIIRKFEKDHHGVIVLHQKNKGPGGARNRGLEVATGHYIAFLDSDDYLPVHAYKTLFDASENGTADIISGKIVYEDVSGNRKVPGSKIFNINAQEVKVDLKLDRTYWDLFRYCGVCCRIFKRELLHEHDLKFMENTYFEDICFNTIANILANEIKIINEEIYYYVQSSNSIMRGNYSSKKYIDFFKVINETLHMIDKFELNKYKYIFDTIVLDNLLFYRERLNDFITRKCIQKYRLDPEEFTYVSETLYKFLKSVRKETLSTLTEKQRTLYIDSLMKFKNKESFKYFYEDKSNGYSSLISIIVPVYNVEKYIRSCLDSLVNQTLKNIEIIIVNDGTNDKSAEIAEEYVKNYSNIKLIHKKNGGQGDARNEGLKHVNSKYVMFVDSDDELAPSACEILYKKARDSESDIVIGQSVWNRGEGREEPVEYLKSWFSKDLSQNFRDDHRIALGFPIVTSKLFLSSLIFNNNIQFPLIRGEDVPFAVQTFFYAKKISIIKSTVYIRTERQDQNNKSTMQTFNSKMVSDRLQVMHLVDSFCSGNRLKDIRKQNLYQIKTINNILLNIEERKERERAFEIIKQYVFQIKEKHLCYSMLNILGLTFEEFKNISLKDYESHIQQKRFNKTNLSHVTLLKHKISIIVPVYNVQQYLKKSLESIEKQTIGLENIEVIMVNDGSTDRSGEIMERYSAKHKNFISIHLPEQSGAAGKPRNVGIENATGDYIMFLDPDDYYIENACETLYKKIVEYDCDLAMGTYIAVNENGSKWGHPFYKNIKEKTKFINSIDQYKDLLKSPPAIWTKIMKKKFIESNNIVFPEKIVAQDLVFSIHCFLTANGIVYTEQPVCNYRVRNGMNKSISNHCDFTYFEGINTAQRYVHDLFSKYERDSDYSLVNGETLDYYIKKLKETDAIQSGDKIRVIEMMRWYFDKSVHYNIRPQEKMHIPIFNKIVSGNYEEAILLIELYKEMETILGVSGTREMESRLRGESHTDKSAEQELQNIYNMRSWRAIQKYRRFMDNSSLGSLLSKVRNYVFR